MAMKTAPRRAATEDNTLVRNQPALTTSTGLIWLLVGGLLAATGIAVLAPMTTLTPPLVAIGGIVVIALLYAAMIVIRFAAPAGRLRLSLMAVDLLSIAAVALVCVTVITAVEWDVIA